MSVRFTEEQLNNFDKATLIQLFLTLQNQLESIDNKMQLMLDQMADMNRHRFGRSSEKSDIANVTGKPSVPFTSKTWVHIIIHQID